MTVGDYTTPPFQYLIQTQCRSALCIYGNTSLFGLDLAIMRKSPPHSSCPNGQHRPGPEWRGNEEGLLHDNILNWKHILGLHSSYLPSLETTHTFRCSFITQPSDSKLSNCDGNKVRNMVHGRHPFGFAVFSIQLWVKVSQYRAHDISRDCFKIRIFARWKPLLCALMTWLNHQWISAR